MLKYKYYHVSAVYIVSEQVCIYEITTEYSYGLAIPGC